MKAQLKIQQMAFMIVAVFVFFVFVGLFFVSYQYKNLISSYSDLQKQQAISSLEVLTNMPELTCGYLCLDIDKLIIMSETDYSEFWPVASIEVFGITNNASYTIHGSEQENKKTYSTYVSLCKKTMEFGYVYDRCEIGKLIVGVKDEI